MLFKLFGFLLVGGFSCSFRSTQRAVFSQWRPKELLAIVFSYCFDLVALVGAFCLHGAEPSNLNWYKRGRRNTIKYLFFLVNPYESIWVATRIGGNKQKNMQRKKENQKKMWNETDKTELTTGSKHLQNFIMRSGRQDCLTSHLCMPL